MSMTGPILVVDDEPMVRNLLAEALQRSGSEVVTAGDGDEALAIFREVRTPLVFTDLKMPGTDGFALLRSVKAMAPETAVVVVTAYGDDDVINQVIQDGAAHVLAKPFTFAELRATLAKLAQRAPEPPADVVPVLTRHPQMEAIVDLARRVAKTDATVLVQGETGSGKEVLSRFIHRESPRARGPFVAVNCAALPESLIEAELFGHERGAFTGADRQHKGYFERAHGGTLFLDEITEIPLNLQAKLLRALQEREIERIGSNTPVKVDVRVIATTNRDIREEVRAGRFRQDLFYRLNVIALRLPPLRDRGTDLRLLARHFLLKFAAAHASPAVAFAPEAIERLAAHAWPGNIRELENTIQRAVILCQGPQVGPEHILLDDTFSDAAPAVAGSASTSASTVADVERQLILSTLERLNGNRTHAAKALGVSVRTIRNRLREYRMGTSAPAAFAGQRVG